MDKETYPYKKRAFLNKKGYHELASILAEVTRHEYNYGDDEKHHNLHHMFTFSISDCSRIINLDFGISDKKTFNNSIHKIDLITKTLTEFKQHLINAYNEEQEFKKNKKDKKNGQRKT